VKAISPTFPTMATRTGRPMLDGAEIGTVYLVVAGTATVLWLLALLAACLGAQITDLLSLAWVSQSCLMVFVALTFQAGLADMHRVLKARIAPQHALQEGLRQVLRLNALAWAVCALPLVLIDLRELLQADMAQAVTPHLALAQLAQIGRGPALLAWLLLCSAWLSAMWQGRWATRHALLIALCGLGLGGNLALQTLQITDGLWASVMQLYAELWLLAQAAPTLRAILQHAPSNAQSPLRWLQAQRKHWIQSFQPLDATRAQVASPLMVLLRSSSFTAASPPTIFC